MNEIQITQDDINAIPDKRTHHGEASVEIREENRQEMLKRLARIETYVNDAIDKYHNPLTSVSLQFATKADVRFKHINIRCDVEVMYDMATIMFEENGYAFITAEADFTSLNA